MEPRLITVLNHDIAYLEMISDFLGDEGYEVLTLHEESIAFDVIKNRQPALVFIELMILDPEAGLMVLNKMRLDPQTTTIPVIIASTTTDLIERNEQHLRSKRCDILLKPFDLEDLLVMVGKYAPL